MVVEKSPQLGGKIRSVAMAGKHVEVGPDAFLTRTSTARDLVDKVGASDQVVIPRSFAASIYARGRLHRVPEGIMLGVPVAVRPFIKTASMLSPLARLRAAADLILPKTALGSDATISHLVASRFGHEVDEVLVDPMVGGINAGSTRVLGLASVAPQFINAYKSSPHRSLARSMVAFAAPKANTTVAKIPFASLSGGLGDLIGAAQNYLISIGVEILLNSEAVGIKPVANGVQIDVVTRQSDTAAAPSTLLAQGVVLALPAPQAAAILAPICAPAASRLGEIDYAGVAMTVMRYLKSSFSRPLEGSGVLVPRREGRLITAVTFASRKWQHLDLQDSELLRVSVGRFGDNRFASLADSQLQILIEDELHEILGTQGRAQEATTWRWDAALPQYRPYHRELAAAIRADLGEFAAIEVCGAALDGVGIPACIESGSQAAARLMARAEPGKG